MGNAELVALLRDAREELNVIASYVDDPAFVWPSLGLKVRAKAQRKMRARIDAALAAHEAEAHDSATPVVEWQTDAFGNDYVKQGNALAMVAQTLDGNFGWETRVEGYADTEAEAQRAALEAARGLK